MASYLMSWIMRMETNVWFEKLDTCAYERLYDAVIMQDHLK